MGDTVRHAEYVSTSGDAEVNSHVKQAEDHTHLGLKTVAACSSYQRVPRPRVRETQRKRYLES